MADKKNLCAQIDTALHARVRQEQEQSGRTLSEFVEQLITDYYKMKEGTKMTGDIDAQTYQQMRGKSYQEVLRTNGQISFPEVLRQQKRL